MVLIFFVGLIETAKKGVETFDAILKLKKEKLIQKNSTRSHHLLNLLDKLYQKPIINALQVVKITEVSMPIAYKILEEMQQYEILKEVIGGKRGQIFMFEPYVKLF